MCDETDRELIRIDFQMMDLKKQQEACESGSKEYQDLQGQIDTLEARKELLKAEQLKAGSEEN